MLKELLAVISQRCLCRATKSAGAATACLAANNLLSLAGNAQPLAVEGIRDLAALCPIADHWGNS